MKSIWSILSTVLFSGRTDNESINMPKFDVQTNIYPDVIREATAAAAGGGSKTSLIGAIDQGT